MIPLTKLKDLIGKEAQALTDEQLEVIRRDMYVLVNMAFDFWVKDGMIKKPKDML